MNFSNCSIQAKNYSVKLEVKLKPDGFRWTGSPILAKVGKKGKYVFLETVLTYSNDYVTILMPESQNQVVLNVPKSALEAKSFVSLCEVWSGKGKGGFNSARSMLMHALD